MKSFIIYSIVSLIAVASMTVMTEAASMNGDLTLICGDASTLQASAAHGGGDIPFVQDNAKSDLVLICGEETSKSEAQPAAATTTSAPSKQASIASAPTMSAPGANSDTSLDPAPVPEPGTVLLMSAGLIGLAGLVKRRNR